MLRKIIATSSIALLLLITTACTPDKKTSSNNVDTVTSASVTESTGKWVQQQWNEIESKMTSMSIPNNLMSSWEQTNQKVKNDLKNEKITDQTKMALETFKRDVEKEIETASGDVKKTLEDVQTQVTAILDKINA